MFAYVGGKKYEINIPDRETVVAIRSKTRLLHAENPTKVVKGKLKLANHDKLETYHQLLEQWAYEAAKKCGFTDPDPVIQESVGNQVIEYIIQGPQTTRPVSIDELQKMMGTLLLSTGTDKEKVDEILKLADAVKKQLEAVGEIELAEADKNSDPTR